MDFLCALIIYIAKTKRWTLVLLLLLPLFLKKLKKSSRSLETTKNQRNNKVIFF